MTKIRLLINFGYYRKQWIAPFEKLPKSFELIYLFYIHPSQEESVYTEHRRVYWSQYSGAIELLDELKPDRVVFMDVASGLGIILNMVSKKRGVPTFLFQHGLYHNYQDYRQREIESRNSRGHKEKPADNPDFEFSTLQFLRKSLKITDLHKVFKFPWFLYLLRKEGQMYACKNARFEARRPDHYICYTPDNAEIHREIDGDIDSRCFHIGNPELFELDQAIRKFESLEAEEYYLLIDQPFADNRYGEHIKTTKEMSIFYSQLSAWCKKNGTSLRIKLHPESYHSKWLPNDENIEWIRETDRLGGLIGGSNGCFGFFSTLMLPVIHHKPTTLFRVGSSPFYKSMEDLKTAQVLEFSEVDKIDMKRKKGRDFSGFINRYFYQKDKDPIELLSEVLG